MHGKTGELMEVDKFKGTRSYSNGSESATSGCPVKVKV
jgi:hypothetical protein